MEWVQSESEEVIMEWSYSEMEEMMEWSDMDWRMAEQIARNREKAIRLRVARAKKVKLVEKFQLRKFMNEIIVKVVQEVVHGRVQLRRFMNEILLKVVQEVVREGVLIKDMSRLELLEEMETNENENGCGPAPGNPMLATPNPSSNCGGAQSIIRSLSVDTEKNENGGDSAPGNPMLTPPMSTDLIEMIRNLMNIKDRLKISYDKTQTILDNNKCNSMLGEECQEEEEYECDEEYVAKEHPEDNSGDKDWKGGRGRKGYFPLQGVSPTVRPTILIRKNQLMRSVHSGRFPPGARKGVSHQPLSPHSVNNVNMYINCEAPDETDPPAQTVLRCGKRKKCKLHRRSCIKAEVRESKQSYYNIKGVYISPPPIELVHHDSVGGQVQKGGQDTELVAHAQGNPAFHGVLPESILPHIPIPQKRKRTSSSSLKYQLVGIRKEKACLDIDRMSRLEDRIIAAAKIWTSRVNTAPVRTSHDEQIVTTVRISPVEQTSLPAGLDKKVETYILPADLDNKGEVDREGGQLATVEGGRPGAKNIMLRASALDHVVKARNVINTTAPAKDSKEGFRYKSRASANHNSGTQEFSLNFENFNSKK